MGEDVDASGRSMSLVAAGALLRALASPVRIAIVLELLAGERRVHELVAAVGIVRPLVSQHLRVLRDVRAVHGQRHGHEIAYRLVDEHLARIVLDAVAHVERGGLPADDPGPSTLD
jgi:ArsR family transcriptional regulator